MTSNKEQLILEAALKLFKEKGFSAVKINDIAKEAGVGKGTIYEYYSSKEELLLKACCSVCSKLDEKVEAVFQTENIDNPVKIIYFSLTTVLTELLNKGAAENKLFHEMLSLSHGKPELRVQMQQEFKKKINQWREYSLLDYQRGLDAGLFRYIEKPQDLAEFIVATIDGLIWQMQWQDEEKLQDQAHRMASVYCQLLLKDPTTLGDLLK